MSRPGSASSRTIEKLSEPAGVLLITEWDSPCGTLVLAGLGEKLLLCDWKDGWHHETLLRRLKRSRCLHFSCGRAHIHRIAIESLERYFAKELRTFDLPLAFTGTAFEHRVWDALAAIPYASVTHYGSIASGIGLPRAARAVGGAVGRNPFSIIIPCHRVIGRSQTLTGYGGGYAAKRRLLALELGIDEAELPYANQTAPGCTKLHNR